jgi:hypothetical protein
VQETRVSREKPPTCANHLQTLSHKIASGTPQARQGYMFNHYCLLFHFFVVFNINNRQQNFCNFRAASIAASAGGANSTRPQVKIWPEWTEAELAAEKWV